MNSNSITESVDIRLAPITNETTNHPIYNMDTDEMIALCCMMTLFFVLGVPGNAVAYYVIYKRRDKTPIRLLILALTAADFISCLVVVPITLATEILRYFVKYDIICKAYTFSNTFSIPLSVFISAAVSFDRYCCICRPFKNIVTVQWVKICLVFLLSLASGLGIVKALSTSVYHLNSQRVPDASLQNTTVVPELHHEAIERTHVGPCCFSDIMFNKPFIDVFQRIYEALYCTSIIIILVLYALIYRTIVRRRKWNEKRKQNAFHVNVVSGIILQESQLSTSSDDIHPENKRASASSKSLARNDRMMLKNIRTATMLFVVVVVLIMSFLPLWLVYLHAVPSSPIVVNTYFLHNVVNPFIYSFMNQTFRQDIKVLIRRLKAFYCHAPNL